MENMQKQQRARDVSAPIQFITLDGTRYKLAFTNRAARVAEDVYEKLCVVCGDNAVTQNEGVFCCGSCGAQYVFLAPDVLWICRALTDYF